MPGKFGLVIKPLSTGFTEVRALSFPLSRHHEIRIQSAHVRTRAAPAQVQYNIYVSAVDRGVVETLAGAGKGHMVVPATNRCS